MDQEKRKLFIMRHGERLDFAIGRTWLEQCFNDKGEYTRRDLNMPKSIPKCKNKETLKRDPPLTELGAFQASLIGEGMKEQGVDIQHVFCSPSYRCVQTCAAFLKGYGRMDMPVAIEPGIYDIFIHLEFLGKLLSNDEIHEVTGLNVRRDYQSYFTREQLRRAENLTLLFERLSGAINWAIAETKNQGNLLFVTHGFTLSVNIRHLLRDEPPSYEELHAIDPYLPFASVLEMVEVAVADADADVDVDVEAKQGDDLLERWQVVENSTLNFTHLKRNRFNCREHQTKFLQVFGKQKK